VSFCSHVCARTGNSLTVSELLFQDLQQASAVCRTLDYQLGQKDLKKEKREELEKQKKDLTLKQEVLRSELVRYGIKAGTQKELQEELEAFGKKLQESDSREEQEKLTRAFVGQTSKDEEGFEEDEIVFGQALFDSSHTALLLGANATGKKQGALVRVALGQDEQTGQTRIVFSPLAKEKPRVNGVEVDASNKGLFDKKIHGLALAGPQGMFPVVACDGENNLYLLNDTAGEFLSKNDKEIYDAGGASIKVPPFALAATGDILPYIFAAVAQGDKWESDATTPNDNRGIAILQRVKETFKVTEDGKEVDREKFPLKQRDPANVTSDGTQAYKLSLDSGDNMVAFAENSAFLNTDAGVTLHWDNVLGRLYIGLTNVGRKPKSPASSGFENGGVISLLVARIEGSEFKIDPVIATPNKDKLKGAVATPSHIVGFYLDADSQDFQASIFNVRTMHTSTGKDYVIVNGGTGINTLHADNAALRSWIFALPVMPAQDASGTALQNAGKLAKLSADKKTFELLDGNSDDPPTVDRSKKSLAFDPKATIGSRFSVDQQKLVAGADPRFLAAKTDVNIEAMEVIGDTVYVSVAADRASGTSAKEAGIFYSTALFDEHGNISSWTPWQRVAGTQEKVNAFGINQSNGSFMFLKKEGANPTDPGKIVYATEWGTSAGVVGAPAGIVNTSRKLSDVLDAIFKERGISRIINFDERTPGFKTGEFSMMVAVGPDKVALIETGKKGTGSANDPLARTQTFADTGAGQNVFVFDATQDDDLKAIAPLTGAMVVADSKTKDKGYLFVSGVNGVARLEHKTSGAGWNSQTDGDTKGLAGLDDTTFPKKDGTFVFKKINLPDGTLVTDVVSSLDSKKLGVLGFEKLFRTKDDVAQAPDALANAFGYASDMVMAGDRAILATSKGLYTTNFTTLKGPFVGIEGTPVRLHYVSQTKGVNSPTGNLYVLAIDQEKDTGRIYRFAVDASKTGITEQLKIIKPAGSTEDYPAYRDLKTLRGSFVTDGTFMFDILHRTAENDKLMRISTQNNSDPSDLTSIFNGVSTSDGSNMWDRISTPVRDTASGAWVVPGQWGVRVNE